ncbi:kinase-like domain-containing protein [Glomus cerebriforme]|uniref:Kinase-like domain-containing protein n=1 Tax=Glomus cerebriforme TaxID=658196 RepID=A0A397SN00_9GLOM|nr:kinase-like domain-containing protein [Glomus cerebriforme]
MENFTQASDIYSFGMVMYFAATGKQPFYNCAHDYYLAVNICKGHRPELNETGAPKRYIDLMKRCWDSNPDNRPDSNEILELFLRDEFWDWNMTKKIPPYIESVNHPQAIYTSRLLDPFTNDLPEPRNESTNFNIPDDDDFNFCDNFDNFEE